MNWLFWFSIADFLIGLVPSRHAREWLRRTQLYDFRKKLNSLKRAQPKLNWKKLKLVKGGQNIGFIVDNKFVFKVSRKYDDTAASARIMREKRITDAIATVIPVRITKITPLWSDEYMYFRYDFIPGKNLVHYPIKEIIKHRERLGAQLAKIIYATYNANLSEIDDLRGNVRGGNGWTHGDFCSNVIVNPKTMDIVGIIDWEFAQWAGISNEFSGINRYRKKMRNSNLALYAVQEYYKLCAKKGGKIV